MAVKTKVGRKRNGKNQYKKQVKIVGVKKYAPTAEPKMLVLRDNMQTYC